MCNDFGNRIPYREYVDAFADLQLPLRFPKGAPNLEPLEDIRPTDPAPMIKGSEEGGGEFAILRWGFPPGRPKAGPVINFRSEGRTFERGRCLIPASHFFEFTGTKYPKTKWRFTVKGHPWFCFAGLWRATETPDGPVEAFTLLTRDPGPDVAAVHDREPIVLSRVHWAAWLDLSQPGKLPNEPHPAGTFAVEEVVRA
jgi:putative SOS response-associated peptidase YedK